MTIAPLQSVPAPGKQPVLFGFSGKSKPASADVAAETSGKVPDTIGYGRAQQDILWQLYLLSGLQDDFKPQSRQAKVIQGKIDRLKLAYTVLEQKIQAALSAL